MNQRIRQLQSEVNQIHSKAVRERIRQLEAERDYLAEKWAQARMESGMEKGCVLPDVIAGVKRWAQEFGAKRVAEKPVTVFTSPVRKDKDGSVRGETKDWSVSVSRYDGDTVHLNIQGESAWITLWIDNASAELLAEGIVVYRGGCTYYPREDENGIDPVYEAAHDAWVSEAKGAES